MSRILALCETPYQIIVASRIITSFYKDYEADIIITNNITDGRDLVDRLKNSKLFNNAFYLQTKNKKINKFINPFINYLNKYKKVKKIFKNIDFTKKNYDVFLFCNIDIVCQHIISILKKEKATVNIFMFEDGLSSYTNLYGDFFGKYIDKINLIDKIRYRFLRNNFSLVEGMYVFNPQYVEWKAFFPINTIPKITKEDKFLINELNEIFLYKKVKEEYNTKYIFFEESYFADGYEMNDLEIIDKIKEIVGVDNILIKSHPRSPVNRFEKSGYKTNTISSVPWEIIAFNIDLEDKILITIASGSVLNPFLIMGINLNAIMLFKYNDLRGELLSDLIKTIEMICIKNPNQYALPRNYNDLKQLL